LSFGATDAVNLGVGLVALGAVTGIAAKEAGSVDKKLKERKKRASKASKMPKAYKKAHKMSKSRKRSKHRSAGYSLL